MKKKKHPLPILLFMKSKINNIRYDGIKLFDGWSLSDRSTSSLPSIYFLDNKKGTYLHLSMNHNGSIGQKKSISDSNV